MRSRHDYALSIFVLEPNDQSHILCLTTSASAFLAFFVRQAFFVEIDSLRGFGLESVGSVHDHQAVKFASTFGVNMIVCRQSFSKIRQSIAFLTSDDASSIERTCRQITSALE